METHQVNATAFSGKDTGSCLLQLLDWFNFHQDDPPSLLFVEFEMDTDEERLVAYWE